MQTRILPIVLIAMTFGSCATAYKTGQTPDDVYYSPVSEVVIKNEKLDERRKVQRYEDYLQREDDRYIRMKVRDRLRWSSIDDYSYWNDSRYNYASHCGCSPGYGYSLNSYGVYSYGYNYYWNNPCYPVIFYKNPKIYSTVPSKSAVTAFLNPNFNNSRRYYNPKQVGVDDDQSSTRQVFTGSENTTNPTRTTTPASSTGSTGGSSGGYGSSGSSAGGRAPRN